MAKKKAKKTVRSVKKRPSLTEVYEAVLQSLRQFVMKDYRVSLGDNRVEVRALPIKEAKKVQPTQKEIIYWQFGNDWNKRLTICPSCLTQIQRHTFNLCLFCWVKKKRKVMGKNKNSNFFVDENE